MKKNAITNQNVLHSSNLDQCSQLQCSQSQCSKVISYNEHTSIDFNTIAGILVIFSVFSLFILSYISILFSFGIETDLLPITVAIMLSAAAGITAYLLSYATTIVIE